MKQVDISISKNQALQILYMYIKLHNLSWIRNYQNPEKNLMHKHTLWYVQTVTDNTIKHRHTFITDLPSYHLIIDKPSLYALIRIHY